MNRILISGAALLLLCHMTMAQVPLHRYNTGAELKEDLTRAGGEYDLYDFDLPALKEAPRGWHPVYISHFGRHGARYALGDDVYEKMLQILRKGLEKGQLTEKGKNLLERYEKFYPSVAYRGGELTFRGQEQHREIARHLYRNFPEVFQGKTYATAISTDVHRVLLSMAAFTSELDRLDKDFDYSMDEGRIYIPEIIPSSTGNPYYIASKPKSNAARKSAEDFMKRKLDLEGFAAKFFLDPVFLDKEYGYYNFMRDLRTIIVDIPNLDQIPEDRFEDVMTPQELMDFWEVWNYNGYMNMGRSPLRDNLRCKLMSTSLRLIMEQADADLESGDCQLRLRFTHDSAVIPLFSFMEINSAGAVIEDPDEVKNYWRCYDCPMASNIQLIFYRHPKKEGTLVKLLLNGREARIPVEEVCPGFYAWEEMKDYYRPRIAEAEDFLKHYND